MAPLASPLKRRLLVAVVCASALALPGCKLLSDFFRSAFKQPNFVFKTVALTDISLGGLTLDTIWQLDNPNAVGLSLASVDYALFIENKQVVAGKPQQGLQIAPNASSDLHFPANVRFQDLAGVVETFLTRDTATWRAEGSIGVQTPIGVLRFPIVKEGSFEVPKIPQVAFGNPRVTNLSLAGATVEFPLIVTNRNTFPLPVAGVTGTVMVAGQGVGTLSTGNLGALDGRGTRQVSLPLQVNFLSAANAAAAIARGGNAQVQFQAQVQSGGLALPIRVDQLVNFIR